MLFSKVSVKLFAFLNLLSPFVYAACAGALWLAGLEPLVALIPFAIGLFFAITSFFEPRDVGRDIAGEVIAWLMICTVTAVLVATVIA